jgi:hypothetical protein
MWHFEGHETYVSRGVQEIFNQKAERPRGSYRVCKKESRHRLRAYLTLRVKVGACLVKHSVVKIYGGLEV